MLTLCAIVMAVSAVSVDAATTPPAFTWSIEDGWLTARYAAQIRVGTLKGQPSLELGIDDAQFLNGKGVVPVVEQGQDPAWRVRYESPTGLLCDEFRRCPALGDQAWERRVTYRNRSTKTQDLVGAFLRVGIPGGVTESWAPETFWAGALSDTLLLCVAFSSREDMAGRNVADNRVETEVRTAWRLQPDQEANAGTQWIWVAARDDRSFQERCREEARKWFDVAGLRVTDNVPRWLPGAIYYKACAGGTIESRSSDIGGYDHFAHQLDYLADLGVTAIMYHSVHKHKTPPDPVKGGWNVYGILDYSEIDPISGGAEAFKRLTDATRARGLHVMGEMGLNGYYSSQAAALRDWWTCYRDGKPVMSFGGASMDYSCPAWQDEMQHAAARLARDFGIEGMRLDLGSGSGDNWTCPASNHASASFLGGSLSMLKALREGATISEYCPVLISEDSQHQPERLATTPLLYGFQQKQLLTNHLPGDLTDAARIKSVLVDFFERERGALPPGGYAVRTLNGLNEVVSEGRASFRFGVGLARALYGTMLAVPGVVQMVMEEEVGSFDAIRAMNWARRRIPEFADGDVDYLSVPFAPEVFTALRTKDGRSALALVNLSGTAQQGHIELPARLGLAGETPVYDAVAGTECRAQDGRFRYALAPYQVAFLRMGRPPVGTVPELRFAGEDSPPPTGTQSNDASPQLTIGGIAIQAKAAQEPWHAETLADSRRVYVSGSVRLEAEQRGDVWLCTVSAPAGFAPTLQLYGADRWAVSARSAVLQDRVLRRHFPFPESTGYHWDRTMTWGSTAQGLLYQNVFPTGRLWQSFVEPLHPEEPGLAFAARSGTGVVIDQIQHEGGNIVLSDCTDEASPDPYHVELRFYRNDPDLSPKALLFGAENTWALQEYPEAAAAPQKLSFRIRSLAGPLDAAFQAARLPVARKRSEIGREGASFIVSENGSLFYAKPGKVTWALPASLKGTYRIQLRLRQSSYLKDGRDMVPGYRVHLDDAPCELEWTQFNAAFIGGAHFADALTPPITLGHGAHTLTIETVQDWCAVSFPFVLNNSRP